MGAAFVFSGENHHQHRTPVQLTIVGADSVIGTWTAQGDTVTATWSDALHPRPSKVALVGPDTVRDDSVFNELVVFWFARVP